MAQLQCRPLAVMLMFLWVKSLHGSCPSGWQQWSGSCYLLQRTAVEQSAAASFCAMYNASLISVNSKDEFSAVGSMLTAASARSYGQSAKYWTGLQRAGQRFLWSDGSPFNRSAIRLTPTQMAVGCASWSPDTADLMVEDCSQQYRPLCERSAALDYIDKCNEADGWQNIRGACYKLYDAASTWNDAQQQCVRDNGNLYMPGSSSYVINRLVTCRISVTHIWVGVSDIAHPGALLTVNGTQSVVQLEMADRSILDPGNTCVEAVTTPTSLIRFQTDVCQHEKQFLCHKPYGTCPPQWAEHKGRCYQLQTTPTAATTWFLAKQQCSDQGAQLLVLNSIDEHMFIVHKLVQYKLSTIWLGFSDEVERGVLRWEDGSAASGAGVWGVWAQDYPSPVADRVDCGLMSVGTVNGSWSHAYCYTRRQFVCEMHIGKTLTPASQAWTSYTCDFGWTQYRDQCFLFSSQTDQWQAASVTCALNNGHLASVTDPYTQSFLTVNLPDTKIAWLGAKKDVNDNQFYWTDSTQVNFTNYGPGQPSTALNGTTCLMMDASESGDYPGGWLAQNCSVRQHYVCQTMAASSGSTLQPTPTFAWSLRCEPGWRLNSRDDLCYLLVSDQPRTWLQARYDCQRRGGDLLSVSGPNEQLHVEAMLSTAYPGLQTSVWMGATDSTEEGGWEWADGSPFRFLHWYPGQPDDYVTSEDCGELVVHWNFYWNDRNCDDSQSYICKKQALPPATSPVPTIPTLVPPSECIYSSLISGEYSVQSEFAFTSSSDLDTNHTSTHSRLIDANQLAWRPSHDRVGEWVGVTFYQTMAVSGLSIAGEPNSFNFVTAFRVRYQYARHAPWYWVETAPGTPQVFDGPTTDDESNSVMFLKTVYAQSIRIFPDTWNAAIAVRFEVTGCVEESCSMDYAVSGPLVVMEGDFSASSMSDYTHSPHAARLHPIHDDTGLSCWRSAHDLDPASPPWVEVNLGTIKLLRGVTIMGNPGADEYVTLFQVQYRLNDGSHSYGVYQQPYGTPMNFTGNTDNNSSLTVLLKTVLPVQHVRLVPLACHGHVALRFDLLVCSLATCQDIPLLSGRHNVSNSAFSASSSRDPQHGPFHSRIGAQVAGAVGESWVAKYNDAHQYIQVDLGERLRVWAVSTQGNEALQQYVRSYSLAFSLDGQLFSSYSADGKNAMVFDGNFDASSVRKHYLMISTVARFVQLWPTDYRDGIALRWEVYGCPGPESGQSMGCFLDEADARDLAEEPLIDVNAQVGPVSCRYHCFDKGYAYAGLQRGIACYCGNSFGKYGSSAQACDAHCLPPYEQELCGGHLANSVYSTGLAPPHEFCDVGWVSHGDYCYVIVEEHHTWFDAHESCRQQGGELVSIKSRDENNYVFSVLASLSARNVYSSIWIGMNDIEESYFFEWNDGSEVTYTNWDVHMPVSDPSQEQHCVALNNQTGGWKTVFCEERMMYACKAAKKPSPIPHYPPIMVGCETLGWTAYKWSCYKLVQEKQSWSDAQRDCNTAGGSLVRVNDRYEQAFVSSVLGSVPGNYWTDVSDAHSPGTFTFSDRSFVSFTAWGPGQPPANHRGCVALGSGTTAGLWVALSCTALQHALCEKPRAGFTPAPTPPLVPPGARCPPGWYESHYSCFQVNVKLANQKLSWDEAREDCQNQGADLASFHAHQDLQELWRDQLASNDGNFWVGLRYNDQDKSLQWSDGTGVNFVQWGTGESDALNGLKNCGEVTVDTGDMAHQFCFTTRNWICSVPRGTIPTPRTTLAAPTAGPPGSCRPLDDRWKMYNGACYLVVAGTGDNSMTWREANSWCHGAHTALVSITSPQEQLFVASLIQNVSSDGLWIGLNKLDVGHGFRWSDGTPTNYENWNVNEPNNFGHLEYCVKMLPKNGKWSDDVCTRKRGFVCKQASYLTPAPTRSTTEVYGYCPPGYTQLYRRHKCVRVFGGSEGEQLLGWSDAWDACSVKGPGHTLASIADLEENLEIVTLLGTNQLSAWIGLRRFPDGTFAWTDRSEVTYTNWDDGEPDGGVQSCIFMKGTSSSAGQWSDAPCFQKANYVCQAPKDPNQESPENIPNPCDVNLGFYPYRAGCYMYVSLGANYSHAMDQCHHWGANLVTINDAFSQAFLRLFIAHSLGQTFEGDEVQTMWIGLNDMQSKGAYTWTLGWPVTFTNWAAGEPSRGVGEGCVSMRPDGLWVDDNCTRELSYICAIINENYTTFTPKPPRGQCLGAPWVPLGDSCYLLKGDDPQTFYEAQLHCQEQQAHLTSVHDNATLQQLSDYVVGQTPFHFWVGLYGSASGGFSWLDHSAVDFTNWATSEPSGTSVEGTTEHCVGLDPRTRQWSDLDCDLHLGYVCRKEQELDNSLKTRPPVIGPDHSPPMIYTVPQKTPATVIPPGSSPHGSTSSSSTLPPGQSAHTTPSGQSAHTTPSGQSAHTTPSGSHTQSSGPSFSPYTAPGRQTLPPFPSSTGAGPSPTSLTQTDSGAGLSSGAVAGVVIAVLVVVAAVVAAAVFLVLRRRAGSSPPATGGGFSNQLFEFGSMRSSFSRGPAGEAVSLGEMKRDNGEAQAEAQDGIPVDSDDTQGLFA